jgi:hypothetical protein
MFNFIFGAGAVGAAARYGSGSDHKMQLLEAPAPQLWLKGNLVLTFEHVFRESFHDPEEMRIVGRQFVGQKAKHSGHICATL